MPLRFLLTGVVALFLVSGCTSESGDLTSDAHEHEHSGAAKAAEFQDPRAIELPPGNADQLIADMLKLFQSARGFRVHSTIRELGLSDDGRYLPGVQSPPRERIFRVEKPGLVKMFPAGEPGPTLSADGEKLTIYVPMFEKAVLRESAPDSPLALLEHPELNALGPPMMFFPLHFASQEAMDLMFDAKFERSLVGSEEIAGQPAYHISLRSDGENGNPRFRWEFWIAATGRPLPLQVRFDLGRQLAQLPDKTQGEVQFALDDRYSGWEIDPPQVPGEFQFEAPADARSVVTLYAQNSPLLDKPAAPFSLEKLDGGTASLAEHAGKNVVVLDFWASSCEPCLESMPAVARIAQDYAARDVVIYSVNIGEPKEAVRKFVEQAKLEGNFLLDPTQRVCQEYGAPPIPMLIIIDKGGVVRAVNKGSSAALDWVVRKQLDALAGPGSVEPSTTPAPAVESGQVTPATSPGP